MSEILEVEIEKMTFGGDGLARHQQLVVFVPFAAPGDLLKVRIVEKKKNFARAEIVEILKSSPHRVTPPCPYYGRCGGCDWQHLSYIEQVRTKESIVREKLEKLANAETIWHPIEQSPDDFRYRNRIQLKYKDGKLGYFARKSHDLISIDDCLIAEEKLTKKMPEILSQLKKNKSQDLFKVELISTQKGSVEVSYEESAFEDMGFSQVNTAQNEKLIATVLDWLSVHTFDEFWDLYAGGGNFTFPVINRFHQAQIKAVELSQKNVSRAQGLIRDMNLSPKKVAFYLSDVAVFLKRMISNQKLAVLVDPPRAGLSLDVVKNLRELQMTTLLYVSCDPASLARDVELFAATGWRLHQVKPFDMFPQTDHIETLIELKR